MENHQKILQVAVVGGVRSGKTSLIKAILGEEFSPNYFTTPSIGDKNCNDYRKSQSLFGNIPVQLMDTPPLSQNLISLGLNYRNAQIFIICIDLINSISLNNLINLVKAIKQITQPSKPVILLVGTKADLIDENKKDNEVKKLENKARTLGCYSCLITSAKDKTNIEVLYTILCQLIEEKATINRSASDCINKQKHIQKSSRFWQKHKHKIINGIIISAFITIAITLAIVLPVAPLLASIGLGIPFTGIALTATLAGIGAAVGLVAGSVVSGIKAGIEVLVKFFQHTEKKAENVNNKDDQNYYPKKESGPLQSVSSPSNVFAAKNIHLPQNFSNPIGTRASKEKMQTGSNTAPRMNQHKLSSSP